MAKTLIDLVCMRLGGSTAESQNLKRKKTKHATIREHSSIKYTKDLEGVKTIHRGLGGYTQRVRSHAPTRNGYNTMTPVHEPLSLCESDPHSPKGSGATVGYLQ
jgi:hypothetical protein